MRGRVCKFQLIQHFYHFTHFAREGFKNSRAALYLDPRHEAGIDEPVDDDLRRPRRVEAGLGDGSHRRRRQKLLKHRKA